MNVKTHRVENARAWMPAPTNVDTSLANRFWSGVLELAVSRTVCPRDVDVHDFRAAKLAALVPPPRAHLTRFLGVFAPNANLRAQLTPSGRGKHPATDEESTGANSDHRSPDEKRRSMTWAQRLKRVFGIDVSTCGHCGGTLLIVASIEEPTTIRAILAHFAKHGVLEQADYRPAPRAPPAVAA